MRSSVIGAQSVLNATETHICTYVHQHVCTDTRKHLLCMQKHMGNILAQQHQNRTLGKANSQISDSHPDFLPERTLRFGQIRGWPFHLQLIVLASLNRTQRKKMLPVKWEGASPQKRVGLNLNVYSHPLQCD